jgi:hypothetical protein
VDPGTDEQRILAWLTTPAAEAEPAPAPAAPAAAAAPAEPATPPAQDPERLQALKARTRQLHASTLTRKIREVAPRLSASRAADLAGAWSMILADPVHLDDWLDAGLRVQDHAVAARCISKNVPPARLRPFRRDTEFIARLRSGADPETLLAG